MESNSKMNEEAMDSIHNSTFWTQCPFCRTEYEYSSIFKNCTIFCPTCRKLFTLEEYQGNPHTQIKMIKRRACRTLAKKMTHQKGNIKISKINLTKHQCKITEKFRV